VVLVVTSALALGSVRAQNGAVPDNDLGLVAEIHTGSCANLASAVAFPLGELTRAGTETGAAGNATAGGLAALGSGLVGATGAAPVWTTRRTLDVAPAQLFGQTSPYAVVVGEAGTTGAVAACGDVGGVVADGAVAVALLPAAATTAGTVAGVAVFDVPPATTGSSATRTPTAATGGERTRVTVYVFRLAGPATATATATATTAASPVPAEATETATETVPATPEPPLGSPTA
jgi:hypothetical protein